MSSVSIEVSGLSKRFRLYHEKHLFLKDRLLRLGRNPYEVFWALRDINFDVAEGETIGILGRNGSGKSTLLKCIAGIITPTTGEVLVRGQVGALLELGAGFQPDLSGRENIYMNASLLGLSTREVERRFDEIVAFAEIDQFIDTQVKFYSSGMYVRLGFAVAVNLEPDVLLIDEVLAVGDERFQRKCLNKIKQFQREGRTILFVTHTSDLVRQICDRAVVLSHGKMLASGPPGEMIRMFRDDLEAEGEAGSAAGGGADGSTAVQPARHHLRFTGCALVHRDTPDRPHLLPGEPMCLRATFEAAEALTNPIFWVAILNLQGQVVFGTNTHIMGHSFDLLPGPGEIEFRFDSLPLLDGAYVVHFGAHSADGVSTYDEQETRFEVVNPGQTIGTVALHVDAVLRDPENA